MAFYSARSLLGVALLVAAVPNPRAHAQSWQFFDAPFTNVTQTTFEDVSGSVLVGRYVDNSGLNKGFRFDRSSGSWMTVHNTNVAGTIVYGVSGNILAGEYQTVSVDGENNTTSNYNGFFSTDHGYTLQPFLLQGQPAGTVAIPGGVVGTKILGTYFTNGVSAPGATSFYERPRGGQGFVHDLSTGTSTILSITNITSLNSLSLTNAFAGQVISVEAFSLLGGSQVVGQVIAKEPSGPLFDSFTEISYGFIHDLGSGETSLLNYNEPITPSETFNAGTAFYAASGTRVVGTGYGFGPSNDQSKGLLYDTQDKSWTLLSAEQAVDTWVFSVEGDEVFGAALFDADPINAGGGTVRAFIYTIPEPSAAGLLGCGLLSLLGLRRRRA